MKIRKGKTKSSTPLVSVVMPVYNAEKYLPQTIESILNQSYKNFEFIIIDDCSTDKSWEIIQRYAKRDKRIKGFKNKKNLGHKLSLQLAKKYINKKSEFIARMDADDVADLSRLEKQINFLVNNSDYVIVGSNLIVIDENNKVLGKRLYPINDSEIRKTMFFKNPFAHPTVLIKKEPFFQIGFYKSDFYYAEDYYCWYKLLQLGKGHNLKEFLLKYRIHSSQVKSKSLKKQLNETIKIQQIIFKENNRVPILAKLNNFFLSCLKFLPNFIIFRLFKLLELNYEKN
jgi:glycosyltransferase involved in cell wall biosynthesis